MDTAFEDFLTYSTYNIQNGYVVFGGTRWGGSFWHHNLEVPLTKSDMARRVSRLYGHESVPAKTPRFFVRVVNSTREVDQTLRLRDTLRRALPEAEEIYLLLIADLQVSTGPVVFNGPLGRNTMVYTISEQDTMASFQQGQASFQLCSETYGKAVAYAVRFWAGDEGLQPPQTCADVRQLGRALVQFDGGDPGRELFTPRKFYGQMLDMASALEQMQNLLAKTRSQMFLLPEGVNTALPFHVECFGKRLSVTLPPSSVAGQMLSVWLNDGILSASVGSMVEGQMQFVGAAAILELPVA